MEIQKLSFRTIKALMKKKGFSVCEVLASTWSIQKRSPFGGQFDVYPDRHSPCAIWVEVHEKRKTYSLQDVAKMLRKEGYTIGSRINKHSTMMLVSLQK